MSAAGERKAALIDQLNSERGIVAFMDWPERERMAARDVIEIFGAEVSAYTTTGLRLAMPNIYDHRRALITYLERLGLFEADQYKMALCSDKPAAHLRHYGRFNAPPDNPSYWLYMHFEQKAPQ